MILIVSGEMSGQYIKLVENLAWINKLYMFLYVKQKLDPNTFTLTLNLTLTLTLTH